MHSSKKFSSAPKLALDLLLSPFVGILGAPIFLPVFLPEVPTFLAVSEAVDFFILASQLFL